MSKKLTYECIDCGKKRTAYECAFTKPRDEYRCCSCARKHRALEDGNSTETRICIDCGKERTAPPSRFTTPVGQYRCKSCAAKLIKPKHPVVYKCIDCGKERISTKSFLNRCADGVYRCKQCDGKRRIKRVTYACIDCGKEHTATPCEFTQPPELYRCPKCATSKWMKENSKRINESRGFDGSSREIVTYKCIECGKERTDMRKSFNKPEKEYICRSCFSTNQANLPERIEMLIKRNKEMPSNPEWVKNHKLAMEKLSKDPTWIENHRVATLESHESETWAINHKAGIKMRSQNPNFVENVRKGIIKRSQNPQWLISVKINSEKLMNNPSWKSYMESRSENMDYKESLLIGVTGQGFWYGHKTLHEPIYKTYCEKWNKNLWNRIDIAWDFKSAISGKTQLENYKRQDLCRHHVYWQEKACCEWDEDAKGYYAMINIGTKSKPHFVKHYIKGDPNKFVLLTKSEHGVVSGNKKLGTTKLTWIKFFEDLIEAREKDGKKCYLTKEEYEEYKMNNPPS